jgi:F-type H+-transporting ATPase subunit epsilon
MAGTFNLKLVTPTGVMFDGIVREVTASGPLGEFGILPEHINFITSLVPCVARIDAESGAARYWVISGGLTEVKDGIVTILADSAESPDSVDAGTAAADEKAAEDNLSAKSIYDPDYAESAHALMLARARRQAASLKEARH